MKRIALLVPLFCVAVASQGVAATTFGTVTDRPVGSNVTSCAIPAAATARSCTVFQSYASGSGVTAPGGLRAPSSGVITSWTTVIGSAGGASIAATPQVITPIVGPGSFDLAFQAARHGVARDFGTGGGGGPFAERLPVTAGDYIAVRVDLTNGAPGDAPYAASIVPGGSGGNFEAHFPALEDGQSYDSSGLIAVSTDLFQLSATVEPDADLDGYGDETQDGCPQRADAHGACPPVAITGFKYKNKKISFTADTPGTYKLRVERAVSGRKSKGRCSTKAKTGKKCTAYKKVVSSSGSLTAGVSTLTFSSKPGSYRATLTTVSAQGVIATNRLKFKIKPAKKKR